MYKNSINGLEYLLQDDIPDGSVVLVSGAEGALKSSLVFNMFSNYLADNDHHGLYASLEEGEESLLRNMRGLGIKEADRLHIFDYKDVRMEWEDQEPEMVKLTENVLDFYKEKYDKMTVFALDSLNGLYSLSSQANLRKSIYRFFTALRDKELTSFVIMESNPAEQYFYAADHVGRPEYFLADGVIEVGIVEAHKSIKRYIQIKKMRAVKHKMEKHQLIIGDDGLSILGSVY